MNVLKKFYSPHIIIIKLVFQQGTLNLKSTWSMKKWVIYTYSEIYVIEVLLNRE